LPSLAQRNTVLDDPPHVQDVGHLRGPQVGGKLGVRPCRWGGLPRRIPSWADPIAVLGPNWRGVRPVTTAETCGSHHAGGYAAKCRTNRTILQTRSKCSP
jgi:hypothetical protein